jgi:hypothetical protein
MSTFNYDYPATYLASDLIGTKILHGSPGYLTEETISKINFLKDKVEIEFESERFTQMTPDEYENMLKYEELFYKEMTHGGDSQIIFPD